MARPKSIFESNPNARLHYVAEWCELRGLRQPDITDAISADKSTVYRWFKGKVPSDGHLLALKDLLKLSDIAALFRHPHEEALYQIVKGRRDIDPQRLEALVNAAFPRPQSELPRSF